MPDQKTSISRRAWRLAGSSRLAAWLIAVQVVFLLISFVIPQRGIFPEDEVDAFLADIPGVLASVVSGLRLDHMFSSPLFYVLATLLVLNLIVCTWDRIRRHLRRSTPAGRGEVPAHAVEVTSVPKPAVERELEALRASSVSLGEGETRHYLRRGEVGFIGSIVMHVALLVVIAGGVASGLTTFRGDIVYTEGQSHLDTPDDYLVVTQVPQLGAAFEGFQTTLLGMEFEYEGDVVIDAVAHMRVDTTEGSTLDDARVNYPLRVGHKSFLLKDGGHSVWLTVTDSSGTVLLDSFVNLLNSTQRGYEDTLSIGDVELAVLSRPDASAAVDDVVYQGLLLRSPIVGISVGDGDDLEDYEWLTPGSAGVSMDGLNVVVNEVRIWNRFMVRADGGRNVIYMAFVLVVIGSVVRFVDPDRWVKVAVVDSASGVDVHVWGAQRYRRGVMPREGQRLIRALERAQEDVSRPGEIPGEGAADDR